MPNSRPMLLIAVPGIAVLAVVVAMGQIAGGSAPIVPAQEPTPYSADHARVQAPDTEQPATF